MDRKKLPDLLPPKKAAKSNFLSVTLIIIGALWIGLGIFCCVLEVMESEPFERPEAVPFDADTYSEQEQFVKFNMLSDPFASFVIGENHGFYFALLGSGEDIDFSIVCLSADTFEQFRDIYEFTFSDLPLDEAPRMVSLSGYAVEIDEELVDFAIEYFNQMFGGEILTSENFSDYFGTYYLDTTIVPETGTFAPVLVLFVLGAVVLVAGIWLFCKKRKAVSDVPALQTEPLTGSATSNIEASVEAEHVPTALPMLEERVAVPHPILGIWGALLGSLVGAAIWIALYKIGFIAGLAGYLAVVCALSGYKKLGGGISKFGTFFCILAAVFALVTANGISYIWMIADEVNAASPGRADFAYLITHFVDIMTFLEAWGAFFQDLAMGLFLALIAGISPIVQSFKQNNI